MIARAAFALGLVSLVIPSGRADAPIWTETVWHGERAFQTSRETWTAIVSVERGRLMHFGRTAAEEENILFAPADREGTEGFGGHRVWLGPQSEWSKIWPPPPAWEKSGASRVSIQGTRLTLEMPPSPQGWPDIQRIYTVEGTVLKCGIALTGGTRDTQVIQILQTPPHTVVKLRTIPTAAAPQGARQLPSGAKPVPNVGELPHVHINGESWTLRYLDSVAKLGFAPQTIVAEGRHATLTCGQGPASGHAVGAPDDGLYTQIYLGAKNNAEVIELEQLTPRWDHRAPATVSMTLDLQSR